VSRIQSSQRISEKSIAGAVSMFIAAVIPFVQFRLLNPLTSEMPTWDQWSEVTVWSAHFEHRPVLPVLLSPYNGHFNLVPRLISTGWGCSRTGTSKPR